MSALGANRTGQDGGNANSRLVHRNKTASLFDHLVGAGEQGRRDFEANRLRGLEIQDKLEFRGLLDRKVTGLGALQNLVDASTAPGRSLRSAGKARSRSATEDTSTGSRRRPRAVAPDRALSRATAEKLFAGFTRTATRDKDGSNSLSNSNRFPSASAACPENPVTLPPG